MITADKGMTNAPISEIYCFASSTNAGERDKRIPAVPKIRALFTLPSKGKEFKRLNPPVYALLKLMEIMDKMAAPRMMNVKRPESLNSLVAIKGFKPPVKLAV
ncbi:hypothetical protein M3936_17795 [Sutcliffiella horikoshii]|uniref:hypothetical protein n=1 Tax=Sutcliffiella horikoshii TaxID=79883 RepID=UPI00203B2EB9|nr:hypothetical protein [Sutcliffiella horikoshii]MCM3619446.1 hypothetical protein [Sutcliffiella horikoshii]